VMLKNEAVLQCRKSGKSNLDLILLLHRFYLNVINGISIEVLLFIVDNYFYCKFILFFFLSSFLCTTLSISAINSVTPKIRRFTFDLFFHLIGPIWNTIKLCTRLWNLLNGALSRVRDTVISLKIDHHISPFLLVRFF
jgi:hypothetical protein